MKLKETCKDFKADFIKQLCGVLIRGVVYETAWAEIYCYDCMRFERNGHIYGVKITTQRGGSQ